MCIIHLPVFIKVASLVIEVNLKDMGKLIATKQNKTQQRAKYVYNLWGVGIFYVRVVYKD